MNEESNADGRVLSTQRVLPFSSAEVFGAIEDPAQLAQWWGPDGFKNTVHRFNFVPGGEWEFTMHGPDGTDYRNTNVFAEIERDHRVVIRHDCEPFFTLTIRLSEVDGGTLVEWEQAFDDANVAQALKAMCEPANEQNLDRLTAVLNSRN